MALDVVSLTDILNSDISEEEVKDLLFTFETIQSDGVSGAADVEYFFHYKAIEFEKLDISRTYLVFSTYKEKRILSGYFSISNRPLAISKKNFTKLTNSMKKRLMGVGHRTEQNSYEIKGFLIGQIGRNFSEKSRNSNGATGRDLMAFAQNKILEAHKIVGGRIVYLECQHDQKLISFYRDHGFIELEDYESVNGLAMLVKRLKQPE
ncbi:hypothetical protein SAMN05421734_10344 [Pelagirhabdus alkalitolerans]|uniref:N-acetyltransferase domain-containing protein n=1 Tax=Pelagirhabdus alkalitolerans TaxID=1612202 RepID=A0A1G6HJ04_9BACI|nr:GNAT family acetyltransferase [Pelagirhabdus alkalitolerans]SDB94230.1 hypothetical protein SAMN05421734_10344 [Pelagirhabdus alkalitolerans]